MRETKKWQKIIKCLLPALEYYAYTKFQHQNFKTFFLLVHLAKLICFKWFTRIAEISLKGEEQLYFILMLKQYENYVKNAKITKNIIHQIRK